jgi:hypothetical protein
MERIRALIRESNVMPAGAIQIWETYINYLPAEVLAFDDANGGTSQAFNHHLKGANEV